MKALKFKTNINCSGCAGAVKPILDANKDIKAWDVDITDKNKTLTITGDIDEYQVKSILEKIGYKAEKIN